jgi:hypothetical protein
MYNISDQSPAVSCYRQHQGEVMFYDRVPAHLGNVRERPGPEEAGAAAEKSGTCIDVRKVRAYMGAGEADQHSGVEIVARWPSREEWRQGSRRVRCDLVVARTEHTAVPFTMRPIKDVLRSRDSARFRQCFTGSLSVTCDKPHRYEAVGPGISMSPASQYPGAKTLAEQGARACQNVVEKYVGTSDLSALGLKSAVRPLDMASWDEGNRYMVCWVARVDGKESTGTVRWMAR